MFLDSAFVKGMQHSAADTGTAAKGEAQTSRGLADYSDGKQKQ